MQGFDTKFDYRVDSDWSISTIMDSDFGNHATFYIYLCGNKKTDWSFTLKNWMVVPHKKALQATGKP